jgi:hypothetical protein
MTDPSDPAGASPVNRLNGASPSLAELVGKAMETVWVKDEDRSLSSQVLDLDEYSAVWEQLDHRELYRAVYTLARTEIALGESHAEIRASFRKMAEEHTGMVETILMAVDDALAARPPKW